MVETSRQNMNIPVLNYISHDRLNFKSSGPRISSDRRDEVYDITSGRHLRAIQLMCYIVWVCV